MKMKKLFASVTAAAIAVSAFSVSAFAYELNTDMGVFWGASATIPGSEFESCTTENIITITYTADKTLADMDGHNYWCVKPMINDTGWPFIDTLNGLTLSEGKDSYVLSPDETSISFQIADQAILEHVQIAGLAFLGHGVTLGELTVGEPGTIEAPAPAEEVVAEAPAEETIDEVPAEEVVAEAPVEEAIDEAPAAADEGKTTNANPNTGVEGVALITGLAVVAAAAIVVSKKRW